MDKIKVLHIVSTISRDSGVMGFIMNMYRNIDLSKVQFDFLYFDEIENKKVYRDEIISLGGHAKKIIKPNRIKNIKEFKREFNSFLRDNKYSIIHLHEVYLNSLIAKVAKKNKIDNIIVHSHTTQYSDNVIKAIRNKILCIPIKKNSTAYFACSKAAGRFLYGDKAVENDNVYIANNGIDCEKFIYNENIRNKLRDDLKINDKFVIGNIGRFAKQKNHEFLIDIFYEIKKYRENSILLLVGDGELKKSIKNKVDKLNLSNDVIFLEPREDINNILQVMDIFVLPSLYEGLPVVAIEAQASGLKCILSNKITNEVNIFNCEFIELDNKRWINTILGFDRKIKRKNTIEYIRNSGYDAKFEAKRLQKTYQKLICERNK